jgi:hypothetical protein
MQRRLYLHRARCDNPAAPNKSVLHLPHELRCSWRNTRHHPEREQREVRVLEWAPLQMQTQKEVDLRAR